VQNGGAGSSLTTPPQSAGACANASGAGRDLPGLRCTGHRAVGSGGHRTNVDSGSRWGSDGATGAALLSVGSRMSVAVELCPVSAVPRRVVTPPGSALRACSADLGELLVWPVTLRHLGRGQARTFAESPAT
jgi:hypothetical protein